MKYFTVLFFGIFLLSAAAQNSKYSDQAPQNFLKALKSDNTGLVECAVFHTVKYKLYYPEQKLSDIVPELENLSQNGKSEIIRYKALLAVQFLKNDSLLAKIKKENYKDANQFFLMLGNELQESLLVLR